MLDKLRAGVPLRRCGVKRRFKCSTKTAKRDLTELRKRCLTEFVPKPTPGRYRLVDANQPNLRAISAS